MVVAHSCEKSCQSAPEASAGRYDEIPISGVAKHSEALASQLQSKPLLVESKESSKRRLKKTTQSILRVTVFTLMMPMNPASLLAGPI